MDIISSLIKNGLQGFHQWQKEMLQAIQDIIDTIKQMDASAIRMFIRGITDFVAACEAMDNFREKVLSELQRAKTYVKNMTFTDRALLGTALTGVVVGGIFGIVVAGEAIAGAVSGVIGGRVLFGACKVGTKWTGYSLNTKRVIKTVGVVSVASAIGGVVCFALGAAISGPVLLGSVVGLVFIGGAAALGYKADDRDERAEMRQEIHQLQDEKEEMRQEIHQLQNEREEMRNEREEMRVRMARFERFMQNSSGGS